MTIAPLHQLLLHAGETPPSRWLLVLHGILGRGANWRSFARQLSERVPGLGLCLVDLREHGESLGRPPPHTVQAAAEDLQEVVEGLQCASVAVLGHSFGGKVALAYAQLAQRPLERVLVIDSNPGARPTARGSETTLQVLTALEALAFPLPSRERFLARLQAEGLASGLAQWLALNLERTDRGYVFRLELPAIRELLADYFQRSLWSVVEAPPCPLHFVVGGRSSVLDGEDLDRLRRAGATAPVTLEVLPEAGHWVHVDAPEQLLTLVSAHCAR